MNRRTLSYPEKDGGHTAIGRSGPRVRGLVTAILLLTVLFVMDIPYAAAAVPLRLGIATWIGYLPVYVALKKGFYQKYGLDLKLITFPGDEAVTAFATDSIDMTGTASATTVALRDHGGAFFKIIMICDMSVGSDGILARNSIKGIADFKGKRIGVEEFAVSHFFLLQVLDKAGLRESDVTLVNLTPAEAATAYRVGAVDIAVTYAPYLREVNAEVHDGRIIVDSSSMPTAIMDFFLVRGDYLSTHPAAVESFVRGTLEGLAFIRGEPREAAAIGAKQMEISEAQVSADLTGVIIPDLAQNIDALSNPDSKLYIGVPLERLVTFLESKAQISSGTHIDVATMMDATVLEEVKSSEGK